MQGNIFVFRPGGPPPAPDNVFKDWQQLVSKLKNVDGRKIIEFDDSFEACVIPAVSAGDPPYPMADVIWTGVGPRPFPRFRARVVIKEGARFNDLRMFGGNILVTNEATATPPIADFKPPRELVSIGLDDGNLEIQNSGTVALFDIGNVSVLFFIQNCIFGTASTFPLIRQTGGTTFLNLLGQNQMGQKVAQSAPGATLVFGALSGAAQVGVDQSTITGAGGNLLYGPVTRTQYEIRPLPPAPAATAPDPFTTRKPNVLLRCDGSVALTQVLPGIRTGFTIGNSTVPLYSGGQEIVVAEVAGGALLKVAPSPGDTIDGAATLVAIAPRGSRTFVSDGNKNWITTAQVGP